MHEKSEAGTGGPLAGAVGRAEPAQVSEHLETLDDRILAHLKGLAPPAEEQLEEPEEESPYWLGGKTVGN